MIDADWYDLDCFICIMYYCMVRVVADQNVDAKTYLKWNTINKYIMQNMVSWFDLQQCPRNDAAILLVLVLQL